VTTVSAGYAREILTPNTVGGDELLLGRQYLLKVFRNGIDTRV